MFSRASSVRAAPSAASVPRPSWPAPPARTAASPPGNDFPPSTNPSPPGYAGANQGDGVRKIAKRINLIRGDRCPN